MTTTMPRLLAGGVAVALLAAGLAATPPAYAATTCTSGVPGDVNGDGYAEIAVGASQPASLHVFYGQPDGVAVNARGTAPNDQLFSLKQLGAPADQPTAFSGLETAFADLNDDGCADLVVLSAGDDDCGTVNVLWGSPKGLSATRRQRIPVESIPPYTDLCGSGFGGQVATGDFNRDGIADLAIGIPVAFDDGSDNGGRGAVVVLLGNASGLSTAAGRTWEFDPESPGLSPSLAEGNFGSVLTAGDFDGDGYPELAFGLPYQDEDAGAVQVLEFSSTGLAAQQPATITSRTTGVPQGARDSFNLGRVLAAGDLNGDGIDDLAASLGTPAAVLVLPGSVRGLTASGSQLLAEKAIGLKNTEHYREPGALAIAPLDATAGEDLVVGDGDAWGGSKPTAGAVVVISGGTGALVDHRRLVLSEATRKVPGSAEKGDGFGGALATPYLQGAGQASLIVSAAGEKVGRVLDAGRIYQFRRGVTGPTASGSRAISVDTRGVQGTPKRRAYFGQELTNEFS